MRAAFVMSVSAFTLVGCVVLDKGPPGRDSSAPELEESGVEETGRPDSGAETGSPESGEPESGEPESGEPESGEPESGEPETGEVDSGEAEDLDADDDGWELDQDCDDEDASVSPGAEELANDGVDNDCDPETLGGTLSGEWSADAGLAVVLGEESDDTFGLGLAAAGDVDGDGSADLWVGARERDRDGVDGVGQAYLVLGPLSGTVGAAERAGATLLGPTAEGANFGQRLAHLGDVDGDGYADVGVGAHQSDPEGGKGGAVWVYPGPFSGEHTEEDVAFLAYGEDGDQLGYRVAGPGDADGDGLGDVLVGAITDSDAGAGAGAVYLLWGGQEGVTLASEASGVSFLGEAAGDQAGNDLAFVGDVDGDGLSELAVGARFQDMVGESAGAAYLVYGDATLEGAISLGDADVILLGEEAGDLGGGYLCTVGDLDGDGGDDLLHGAAQNDSGGTASGAAWLLLASTLGRASYIDMGLADAEFAGEDEDDLAGAGVGEAGDVNGDGALDLLIGANGKDTQGGGAYLIYGPITGSVDLDEADVRWRAPDTDVYLGTIPIGFGDTNGDGYPDVALSADRYDADGLDVGAVFVWAGGGI